MSNHVTDFEPEIDFAIPPSPALGHFKRSPMMEEMLELLWQNGQPVTQSQTHRASSRRTPPLFGSLSPSKFDQDDAAQPQQSLYLHEDEMIASYPWLQYPLTNTNFDENEEFCTNFLFTTTPSTATTTVTVDPTIQNIDSLHMLTQPDTNPPTPAPPRMPEATESAPIISKERGRIVNPTPDGRGNPRDPEGFVRESTVVDSSATPAISWSPFRISEAAAAGISSGDYGCGAISGATVITETVAATNSNTTANPETATCDVTTTSSEGGSSSSAQQPQVLSGSPDQDTAAVDKPLRIPSHSRKRKKISRTSVEVREDANFESANEKKAVRGSASKRSRAAEVHNLSERRRRDRINEKMRALQELIPRCNKSDKASMLDEAIEYLKSLQLQVQMMSMGCGMVPMMFPGMQQYMSTMGMGMGMGMNRPVIPLANVISTPSSGSRFALPAFQMAGVQNPNMVRVPNYSGPFLGVHQMQNQGRLSPISGGRAGCSSAKETKQLPRS